MFPDADTIVALSTPSGRSGIAVIRLSGSRSLEIARALVASESFSPNPHHVVLRDLHDPATAEVLDRALITFFRAPRSFTGEDVIELSCHGSPVLLRSLIDITLRLDARVADPGEFTLRALRNGRLSLTQAEAVRDLIDAQTNVAAQQATRQLRGEVSHRLQPMRDHLLEVIVRLESSLEFVEDDLPQIETAALIERLQTVRRNLDQLADTFKAGRLFRDGLRVALVGRPNVGKSSLFNRLLAHERAIVTDLPGTTRDTLTEALDLSGIPVLLTDTAGVRRSDDQIESMGVERTRRAAADADLVILVIDGSEDLTSDDHELILQDSGSQCVIALNKSDLPGFNLRWPNRDFSRIGKASAVVTVSARTEAGLDDLRAAILKPFTNGGAISEALTITNARHHDLLRRAVDAIESSEQLLRQQASEEIVLVGLHNALRYLGEIVGETTTDDMLAEIFSTFCIGK